MTQTIATTSWGKGELSPQVRGHVDTTHYYSSAKSLGNMIVRPYAIPVRRAGTKFVSAVKTGNAEKEVRLIEFVFSVDQSYIIEMGEYYFLLYDSAGDAVTYDLSSVSAWVDTTVYEDGNVVEQSSGFTAWVNDTTYSVDDYVSNGGNDYVCIQLHQSSFPNSEPGVGSNWESWWSLATTPHLYFVCTKDHTAAAADNKPEFGTDWGDVWYRMKAADGLTSSEWHVEVTHPYTEAQLWDVDYAQKNDVIKLTHNQHDIAELRRYDDNVWLFTQGVVEGPPWEDLNENLDYEIKSNGVLVGTGKSITARGFEPFSASDVGRYFRIGGLEDVSGEQGYFKCTSYVNSTNLGGENIKEILNDSYTSAWARNAFYTDPVTSEKNYPAHVTFHEGRLVLASTPSDSAKLWLSKSFIYNDFNVGDTVAFGFDMEANTAQSNKIEWLSSSSTLATGTFGAEFSSESSADTGLNNDTKNIREQSAWGSKFVKPPKIGSRLYYVQRTGRKIREYVYSFDVNSFQSADMTEFSDHITISGVVDMHYQRNQDSLLWCVLADGGMAILSRNPAQEIQAWTPWETTNGDVKSVRFIPNPDGASDRGFALVKRVINSVTVKYIECFDSHVVEDDTLQVDLYYVDCGVTYASSATNFTGLDHLEGQTVAIFVAGIYEGTAVVASGSVANPAGLGVKAAVGLPYTSTYQSNPLNAQTPSGMAKGRIRRINEIALEFYKSLGMEYSNDGTNWFPVGVPEGEDDTVLFTGTIPNLTFEGKLDYDGYLYLRQAKPYSMNLLGIYAQAEIARG